MILYLVALTLASWACLLPMLRDPYRRVHAPEPMPAFVDIPDTTFSARGFT
jgi:hypothetical protein